MNTITKAALAAFLIVTSLSAAQAAETKSSSDAGRNLPAACTGSGAMGMGMGKSGMETMGNMGNMGNMDEAHQSMMAGMGQMQEHMTQGMTAKNIDVAFICGMIPHHQGAIDMAQTELKYGKDPFARKMAKNVIAAQEKEIAEMLDWLKTQEK